jgi:hypothetical protein
MALRPEWVPRVVEVPAKTPNDFDESICRPAVPFVLFEVTRRMPPREELVET